MSNVAGPPAAHPRGRAPVPDRADAHRGRGRYRGRFARPGTPLGCARSCSACARRAFASAAKTVARDGRGAARARRRRGRRRRARTPRSSRASSSQLRVLPGRGRPHEPSLLETGGTLGVVSQFTLLGDARQGRRPSYTRGRARRARRSRWSTRCSTRRARPACRSSRAASARHMDVALVNSGPVTILLDTRREF